MSIDDKIRDEKLQYDGNREATKISALSSGKIGKHEYLTGEEIVSSNRSKIIKQAKFTYSPLGKALEMQTEKQVNTLKFLNPSDKADELNQMNDLIRDRLKKLLNYKIVSN